MLLSVPPGWADATTDGAILLITVSTPLECQLVYSVPTQQAWERIRTAIQAQNSTVATIRKVLDAFKAQPLGSVQFKGKTDQAVDATQLQAIAAAFGKDHGLATAAVWVPRNEAPSDQSRQHNQSLAIEKSVATAGFDGDVISPKVDPVQLTAVVTDEKPPCAAITFLVAKPIEVPLRFIVADRGEDGAHDQRSSSPEPVIPIGVDGTDEQGALEGVAAKLRLFSPKGYDRFELATRDLTPSKQPTQAAFARTQSIRQALVIAKVVASSVQASTTPVHPHDAHFASGVSDVVFLHPVPTEAPVG